MFQYRVEDKIFDSDTLQIYDGIIKSTQEEIEIIAIKRDCYKNDIKKVEIEKYLKSLRDILIMIDIFSSKIFPTPTDGEWLIIVETKKYYNLRDFILNNISNSISNNILLNIDILSLIYELISTLLTFTNYSNCCYFYQRLIPQNIFISHSNSIYLKFPYWLLLENDNDNKLFCESDRYYIAPHRLFMINHEIDIHIDDDDEIDIDLLCNVDIWSLGCCIAEIFYGLPLFSSINISDQFLKIFEILRYPKWNKIPWKYWKINKKFKKMIEIKKEKEKENNNNNNNDSLNKIINNVAIVDLLRCCLEYTSSKQISLNQLSVFLDMFEININNKTQQKILTFNDIQIWNKYDNNDNDERKENVILIGSSTFINEWSLLSSQQNEKENEETIKQQKGCQTTKIETIDNSTNTEQINHIQHNLNITDCIKILPFNNNKENIDCNKSIKEQQNECNLLIIEFSNICNIDKINMQNINNKSFSFQCKMDKMDKTNTLYSSPIFNIDNLRESNDTKQRAYIHIILSSEQCESILNDKNMDRLNIEFIAHNKEYNKSTKYEIIGQIIIDITLLREYKIIEGYYHIFPISNINDNDKKLKLGQVYIRVLPQFNISDCNESIASILTDDQSVVSNKAWKMFNTFVKNHK